MKKNKIPGSIIAFLVLLIVFVIILVALVVPTITKLPKYNEDHATISAQIATMYLQIRQVSKPKLTK